MSREFNGSTQSLDYAGGVASNEPLTMACWFRAHNTNENYNLISIGNNGTYGFFRLALIGASAAVRVQKQSNGSGSSGTADTATSFSPNAWHHGCAVFSSDNSRAVYLDGGNKQTNATQMPDPTADFTNIGVLQRASKAQYMDGEIAEAAIWQAALTDAEVASLGKGVSPLLIRPSALIMYVPLVRDNDKDIVGGISFTASGGPTVTAHPRIFYPNRRIYTLEGEVGPVTITGTGDLQAQDAAVSGVGTVVSEAIEGAGVLQADSAAVSGAGIQIFDGPGALQADSAEVLGFGAIVQDGTGALQAEDAAVSGVGELGAEKSGAGALQAEPAAVTGTALRIPAGTGALVAADAAVSGTGLTEGLISGTGTLQAADAAVEGAGEFSFDGVGALQAQSAAVAGSGFLLGELTLTPADLAAIQDAVWAKLVNEGLVAQINELWQRRGLDAANPQTYDKAGNQIRVGNITIDLTGDPSSVTQTRQP